MPSLHQHLPANTLGRDFIVGDLHGCLDLLQAELARIGFDRAVDRLFSVGDLADRGPDSIGCLRLLREPWFHAVRGNHEDMLLGYVSQVIEPYASSGASALFFRNGGGWICDLAGPTESEFYRELLPRVRALPYVMTVGKGAKRFHVVHAELMTGAVEDTWFTRLAGEDRPKRILTDRQLTDRRLAQMTEALTWGRRVVRGVVESQARDVSTPAGDVLVSHQPRHPGLSLTYVGHTPLTTMILHASHLFIDRGAYARTPDTRLQVVCHDEVSATLPLDPEPDSGVAA